MPRQSKETKEINRIIHKIKRYLFYEKKLTTKLQVKNNVAIDLFFNDQKIQCDTGKKEFLLNLYNSGTNEILNTRTFRAPRGKGNWRKLYTDYLRSEEWKAVREKLFIERGKICECCGSEKKIHVHHLHYNTLTFERMEDLKVLCEKCHNQEHININRNKEKQKAFNISKSIGKKSILQMD